MGKKKGNKVDFERIKGDIHKLDKFLKANPRISSVEDLWNNTEFNDNLNLVLSDEVRSSLDVLFSELRKSDRKSFAELSKLVQEKVKEQAVQRLTIGPTDTPDSGDNSSIDNVRSLLDDALKKFEKEGEGLDSIVANVVRSSIDTLLSEAEEKLNDLASLEPINLESSQAAVQPPTPKPSQAAVQPPTPESSQAAVQPPTPKPSQAVQPPTPEPDNSHEQIGNIFNNILNGIRGVMGGC